MPKIDNARKLRDICYIDPYDMEFNDTMKNARKKVGGSAGIRDALHNC